MSTEAFDKRLINIPMLRESECASILEQINGLRHRWITRNPNRFYSLGRATYLDTMGIEPAKGAFQCRLKSDNYLLQISFKSLYLVLGELLQGVLGGKVEITREFAVPGFHIFLGEASAGAGMASPHFDMQYRLLKWAEEKDEAEPISFTLPIRLPRAGGGLDVWKDTPADMEGRYRRGEMASIHQYAEKLGPRHFHRYSLGHLTVHLDRVLHRVGSVAGVQPDDARITLQGHGRKLDGVWHIYW
ncbi:hypothetical protein [Bradyrhizobium sp.]|jgi:hypothetical protein|uniref:hypothetical protein n=1 Tax=Bradyrhizobium sp. TaxID=376 RepID=UPI002E03C28D|nr:hypothetical protein [Bradyrhizobium sp.]